MVIYNAYCNIDTVIGLWPLMSWIMEQLQI